jgi:hypothetical protein
VRLDEIESSLEARLASTTTPAPALPAAPADEASAKKRSKSTS